MIPVSAQTVPAQGKSAAQMRQTELREIRQRIESSFLKLGAILRVAHDCQDWKTLGYLSFAVYVDDTLRVSKSEAYDLMRIANIEQRFPDLKPRILDAGKSNMRTVLTQISDDADYNQIEKWVDCAAVNTWRELQGMIRDEPMQQHKSQVRVVTIVCRHCGTKDAYEVA